MRQSGHGGHRGEKHGDKREGPASNNAIEEMKEGGGNAKDVTWNIIGDTHR